MLHAHIRRKFTWVQETNSFSIWFWKYIFCSLTTGAKSDLLMHIRLRSTSVLCLLYAIGTTSFLHVFWIVWVPKCLNFLWIFACRKNCQVPKTPPNSSYIEVFFFKYIIIEIREYKNAGWSSVNWFFFLLATGRWWLGVIDLL